MRYIKLRKGDVVRSSCGDSYNTAFNTVTGEFSRWGRTHADDPEFSPCGPEIADIEITDICRGIRDKSGRRAPCPMCYKSCLPTNTGNMSLDTFKHVFAKIKRNLSQIAFGTDAEAASNTDLIAMMEHCRENGVVPNVTVADIDDDMAQKLAELCGAVSVSAYYHRDIERCYDSVASLVKHGLKQCNIHSLVASEFYEDSLRLLDAVATEPRLKGLNAVVLLSLKRKGRGEGYGRLDDDKFKRLVEHGKERGVKLGFDSCSAFRYLGTLDAVERAAASEYVESCESLRFSCYINCHGELFPCSFTEGTAGWETGIDVAECDNFLRDVWFNERVVAVRDKIVGCSKCGKSCYFYEV